MSKDFDFNRIGKRLPYTTPEGFLDDMEKQVWERVKDEVTPAYVQETFTPLFMNEQVKDEKTETPSKPKRNYRLWYSISGGLVAASVTLLLIFNILPDHQKTNDFEVLEQAFSNLSNADQDYLLTVYQDDLFIN